MSNKIRMSAIAASVCGALMMANAQAGVGEVLSLKSMEIENQKTFTKGSKDDMLVKQQYYIVRLESPALVNVKGALQKNASGNKYSMQSQAVQSHVQVLAQERSQFASTMAQAIPGAQVERHFDSTINAVVVKSQQDIYEQLKALPGVTKVFKSQTYTQQMDSSLSLINAPVAWEKLGGDRNVGKGIRVAIVDSGIVPTNPMFDDSGMEAPSDLPTDDYCHTVEPSFCNNKVIVARYSLPTGDMAGEVYSPLDKGGHGTHVAGTAAGSSVSAEYKGAAVELSGVAPGAYIMVYKGLFNGSGSDVMLLEALEYALEDGADVINNSWGGGYGTDPKDSLYKEIFENIEKAGVVAVVSAGNGGSGAMTIGGPANLESVISVANTNHGRIFTSGMKLDGGENIIHITGSNTPGDIVISAKPVAAAAVDSENVEGCQPFSAGAFNDAFAVISRGLCNFSTKAKNAADAGAKAIVIYNNRPGSAFVMDMASEMLPAFMIDQTDGEALVEAISAEGFDGMLSVDGISQIVHDEAAKDSVTSSSSRGPNGDPSIFKPNIAAPGTNTLSAGLNASDGSASFTEKTGTSMSGPHVAGAAALLKQKYPTWSAEEIKSALANTSYTEGLKKSDTVTPADGFDVGAGRLDLAGAIDAQVTFSDMGLSEVLCLESCDYNVTVRNMTDSAMKLSFKVVGLGDGVSAGEHTSELELAAHGEAGDAKAASLTLNITGTSLDDWQFARLEAYNEAGERVGHVPLAAYAASASLPGLAISTSGASLTEEFDVNISFTNEQLDGQLFIDSLLPESLEMVDGSFTNKLANGEEVQSGVNVETGHIGWIGTLDRAKFSGAMGAGINYRLQGQTDPVDCSGNCDDTQYSLNLAGAGFTMKLGGKEYGSVTVTSNGLVIAGSGTGEGTGGNSSIPSTSGQNSLIAPFWTDLDLQGDGETEGGQMYFGLASTTDSTYLVLEWADAQLFSDTSGDTFSFQAWISLNGEEEVLFNYIDVPRIPERLTVGVENDAGSIGLQAYYNGEGQAPVANQLMQFTYQLGGDLDLGVKVKLAEDAHIKVGAADVIEMDEDTVSEAIDVLANDTAQHIDFIPLTMRVSGADNERAIQSVVFDAPEAGFDAATLAVVDAPANGTVEFVEGKAVYTPNADFFGTDSFTYTAKAAGESELMLAPTTVTIEVADVAEPEPEPTTPDVTPEPKKSSSGSLAWLMLLAAPFAALRRRKQK
ncbi:S8 family serine peptidase [Pseudoalteromonas sp. T1lg23B]|uniref:S8 family serine peptidase n=1 Tax=Pseudoalteromonas sp. T1lg23B TaxID=2077097 RepID=UPI000CF7448B|nr:S8 family serine peptidase [Pseudoalteromonas sp. T1lg23B]